MGSSTNPMDDGIAVAIAPQEIAAGSLPGYTLKKTPGKLGFLIFGILAAGMVYAGSQLAHDLSTVHTPTAWPYLLLGLALLIALGFEFVNGFHDTANAVATV